MHEVAKYNKLPIKNLMVFTEYMRVAAKKMRPLRHRHSAVGKKSPLKT